MTSSNSIPTTSPGLTNDHSLMRAARHRIWLICLLSLIAALAMAIPFIGIVELARSLEPALHGAPINESRVWKLVAIISIGLVLGFASGLLSGAVSHDADNDLQHDLRTRLVGHIRRLPLGWFDKRTSGTVKKLVENDVTALHQLVAHAIQDTIMAATIPVILIGYLFIADWRVAIMCLIPLIVTLGLYAMMMRDVTEKYRGWNDSIERMSAATIEYVHGIAVVKSFGQAGRSHGRYRQQTDDFVDFYDTWMRETSREQTLVDIVTSPVVQLGYLSAASTWLTWSHSVSAIDALAGILLGLGLTAPLLQLGSSSQFLREAYESRKTIAAFLAEPTIAYPDQFETPSGSQIDLNDVSFSYDGENQVLRDITLSCPPGTVTALVGPSGSGKSTLARLIPRFYDATNGTVTIGQADVTHIEESLLYQQVGFVFQDAYLLRTSVRDNIRLTKPDASDQEVERVARIAQIHDRIVRLPRGYDSVIGEDAHLSGGEEQRLTIARALLTDAPILVLDEATAFADPDSEAAIQAGLSALAAERTLVVIAHRLHTIIGADSIVVLDQGRIVEHGTHDELVAAQGAYAQMWRTYSAARTAHMIVTEQEQA